MKSQRSNGFNQLAIGKSNQVAWRTSAAPLVIATENKAAGDPDCHRNAPGRRISAALAIAAALAVGSSLHAAASIIPTAIEHGAATFAAHGPLTTITAANRTIIDYSRFNIPTGDTVRFIQPNAAATVLNRINSAVPSQIDGNLFANGVVYLVNPAGVMFGADSVVDVGQLYAAASHITNQNFLSGTNQFIGGNGLVDNEGVIQASAVNFIGRQVSNEGTILAPRGMVALAAGNNVYLGKQDGNVYVELQDQPAGTAAQKAGIGVSNTGTINAGGGSVSLTAGDVYSIAARESGTITAASITVRGGSKSTVLVSGKLDASNQSGSGASPLGSRTGGTITIGGGQIGIGVDQNVSGNSTTPGANINASGTNGGGKILIGVQPNTSSPTGYADAANYDFVSNNSALNASATINGNGGFIDTSGANLQANPGAVITATGAGDGKAGEWLLDPFNVDIVDQSQTSGGYVVGGQTASSGGYYLFDPPPYNSSLGDAFTTPALTYVTTQSIEQELDAGTSVTIATWGGNANTTLGLTPGNIDVRAPIEVTYNAGAQSGATLTLDASNQITTEVGATITAMNGPLNITLNVGEYGDGSSTAGQPGITINGNIATNGGHLYAYSATASPSSNLLDFVASLAQTRSLGSLLESVKIGNWSFIYVNAPVDTLKSGGIHGGAVLLSSQANNPLSGLWSNLLNLGVEFSTSLIGINSPIKAGSVSISGGAYVGGIAGITENLSANTISAISVAAPISCGGDTTIASTARSGDAAGISTATSVLAVSGNIASSGMNLNSSAASGMASVISLGISNITVQGTLVSSGGTIKVASSSLDSGQAIVGGSISTINLSSGSSISGANVDINSQSRAGTQNTSLNPQFTRAIGISAESFIEDVVPHMPMTLTISGNLSSSNVTTSGEINTDGGYCTIASGSYSSGAEQSGTLTSAVAALEALVSTHPGFNLSVAGIGVTSSVVADGGYVKSQGGNVTLDSSAKDTGDGGGGVFIYTGSNITETAPIYAGNGRVAVYSSGVTDQATDLPTALGSLLLSMPLSGRALKDANPQTLGEAISDILQGNGINVDQSPAGIASFLTSLFSANFSLSSALLYGPINAGTLTVESGVPAAEPGGQIGAGLGLGLGDILLGSAPISATSVFIDASAPPSGVSVVGPTLTLAATLSGTLFLGGGSITTSGGGQTYTGSLVIGSDTTLKDTGSDGPVEFNGAVNGPGALTVNAGGQVIFFGGVGNIAPLSGLAVTSTGIFFGQANSTTTSAITTAGDGQTYDGPVILEGATSLSDGNGGDIDFLGPLNGPGDLTVNTSGYVYFAGDIGDSSIIPDLTATASAIYIPAGGGSGQQGDLFVASLGNGAVGEYTRSGSVVNASLISGLSAPWGIAVTGADLFVANSDNNTIGEYTITGTTVSTDLISLPPSTLGNFGSIAESGSHLFIMTDYGTVGEYTIAGATVNANLISRFEDAYAIAASGADLFITYFNAGTVSEYSTSGATVNAGLITGTYFYPSAIAASGSDLFVANMGYGTVGEYTTSGATVNADLISGLGDITGIAVAGSDLFVVNNNSGTVGEYTTSGATVNADLISGLSSPSAIAVVGQDGAGGGSEPASDEHFSPPPTYSAPPGAPAPWTGSGTGGSSGGGTPPSATFIPPSTIQPPPTITPAPENNSISSAPIVDVGGALTSIGNTGSQFGNANGGNATNGNSSSSNVVVSTSNTSPAAVPNSVFPLPIKVPSSNSTNSGDLFSTFLFNNNPQGTSPKQTASSLTTSSIVTNGSDIWTAPTSSITKSANANTGGGIGSAINNFLGNAAKTISNFFGSWF